MNVLCSFALIVATITSAHATVQAAPIQMTTIETKTAVVMTDTPKGNYVEFLDKSGGWWIESDGEHPNFEVGR